MLGIDGEFYEIRKAKKIMFQIDRQVPKLKILRRNTSHKQKQGAQELLKEIRGSYKTTLF